jgi:chitodextrinase
MSTENSSKNKLKQLTIRSSSGGHRGWMALTAALAAVVGAYAVISSFAAAGAATLSLTPSSSTVALGSNFTVTVNENSTDTVNAVQSNLTYPTSTMQFVSVDYTTSGFDTQAQSTVPYNTGTIAQSGTTITGTGTTFTSAMTGSTITYSDGSTATVTYVSATSLTSSVSKTVAAGSTYTIGAGSISIARGSTVAVTGAKVIAVITFKATALGSSQAVNFGCVYNASTCANGNAVIRSTDNGAETLTQTGGTYTIADQTAPSIPTGLNMASHTDTSIGLSWTASTDNVGVTGYKVFRNGTQIATPATTSYTDTGLTPNTTYTYTIAANDAAGNTSSQSTGVAAATLPDTTVPSTPGTPTLGTRTMTSISMNWTASTDDVAVVGYKVFRNGTQIATSNTTSYSDTGLAPGTTYTYAIAATDAAGNTSAQSTASLATLPDTQAPTAPSALNVTSKTATSISLTWTGSTDNVAVTGYKIYRNGAATAVATVAATTFTDVGLSGNTSYSYQVSAIDAAGNESTKSTAFAVTTAVNGDLNGDGHVNVFDLSIFLNHWQETGANIPEDFNNDGVVNIFDLSIMLTNYGI